MKPLASRGEHQVLAFVEMPLDPHHESSKLKDTTDGIYTDVFDGLSYDEMTRRRLPKSCWTAFPVC